MTTREAVEAYGLDEGYVVEAGECLGLLLHPPRLDGGLCVFCFSRNRRVSLPASSVVRSWRSVADWVASRG